MFLINKINIKIGVIQFFSNIFKSNKASKRAYNDKNKTKNHFNADLSSNMVGIVIYRSSSILMELTNDDFFFSKSELKVVRSHSSTSMNRQPKTFFSPSMINSTTTLKCFDSNDLSKKNIYLGKTHVYFK